VDREKVKQQEADVGEAFLQIARSYKRWTSLLADRAIIELQASDSLSLRYNYRSKQCIQVNALKNSARRHGLTVRVEEEHDSLIVDRRGAHMEA